MWLRTSILRDWRGLRPAPLMTGRFGADPRVAYLAESYGPLRQEGNNAERTKLPETASRPGCGNKSKRGNTYNVVCQFLFDNGRNTNLLTLEWVQRCKLMKIMGIGSGGQPPYHVL